MILTLFSLDMLVLNFHFVLIMYMFLMRKVSLLILVSVFLYSMALDNKVGWHNWSQGGGNNSVGVTFAQLNLIKWGHFCGTIFNSHNLGEN